MGVAKVVVLASGKGSNLRALHSYSKDTADCAFELVAVVSDKEDSGAVAYADEHGLQSALVPFDRDDDRIEWDETLTHTISSFSPDWVVLAGFMRIVGSHTVKTFQGKMVNIHPSLLPSFRGRHAIRQALRAGVRISGCTVHLVDHDVDTGPILGQAAVRVDTDDSEQALQARIQVAEHQLLPAVVNKLCGRQHSTQCANALFVV